SGARGDTPEARSARNSEATDARKEITGGSSEARDSRKEITADPRRQLTQARRVVVKIGSRLLADSPAGRPAAIADQVTELRRSGIEILIVSSGAIALGVRRL